LTTFGRWTAPPARAVPSGRPRRAHAPRRDYLFIYLFIYHFDGARAAQVVDLGAALDAVRAPSALQLSKDIATLLF